MRPELLLIALSVAFGVATVFFVVLNEQNSPRLARVPEHGTCTRAGMEAFDLTRLLTLAGLMIGTCGYFMLIRRRRTQRDEDEARRSTESHQRAAARFRRLQRRDEA